MDTIVHKFLFADVIPNLQDKTLRGFEAFFAATPLPTQAITPLFKRIPLDETDPKKSSPDEQRVAEQYYRAQTSLIMDAAKVAREAEGQPEKKGRAFQATEEIFNKQRVKPYDAEELGVDPAEVAQFADSIGFHLVKVNK